MKAFLGSCKVKNFLRASLGNSIYSDLSAFDFQVNLKSRRNNELVVKLHAVEPPFKIEMSIISWKYIDIISTIGYWLESNPKTTWTFFLSIDKFLSKIIFLIQNKYLTKKFFFSKKDSLAWKDFPNNESD